jgi:hypothetical protein
MLKVEILIVFQLLLAQLKMLVSEHQLVDNCIVDDKVILIENQNLLIQVVVVYYNINLPEQVKRFSAGCETEWGASIIFWSREVFSREI